MDLHSKQKQDDRSISPGIQDAALGLGRRSTATELLAAVLDLGQAPKELFFHPSNQQLSMEKS
jgi:hypothetical protein